MKIWVIQKAKNYYRGIFFKKKKNKYKVLKIKDKLTLKDIKGQRAHIVNVCQNPYLSKEYINKTSPEIIKLQLQEKIKETGIYEHQPWIAYKIEKELEDEIEVTFASIEKECFLNILEETSKNMVRIEKLIPDFLTIPWLTINDTDKNILSLYLEKNRFFIFLTGRKKILFFRKIDVDPLLGLEPKLIEENILASLDYCDSFLKEPVEKILAYGPKKDILPKNIMDIYEPKFNMFENIERELIISEPYFFGALLVPNNFNFLPEDHKIFLKHLKIARSICIFLIAGTLLNYGLWFTYKPKLNHKKREVIQLYYELEKARDTLNKNLIKNKEKINFIKEINNIINNAKNMINIEYFIEWTLKNIKPENIIEIKGKKIETTNQQNEVTEQHNKIIENVQNSFIITLHLTKNLNDNINEELNNLYQKIEKKVTILNKEIKTEGKQIKLLITGTPKNEIFYH